MKQTTLIFLATGFEEVEALTVVDVLRRGGVEIKTVACQDDPIVVGAHNIPVQADMTIGQLTDAEPQVIVLPGGLPGADNLNTCAPLVELLKRQHQAERWIAAICAAPQVLSHLNIEPDQYIATCYPGFESKVQDFKMVAANVVQAGHFLTAMGPAYATDFALTLLEILQGVDQADQVAEGMLYCRG